MGNRPSVHLKYEMAEQVQMEIEQIEEHMSEYEQRLAQLKKQKETLLGGRAKKETYMHKVREFGASQAGKILHRIIINGGGHLVKTIQYDYYDAAGVCITAKGILRPGLEDSDRQAVTQDLIALIHDKDAALCEQALELYEKEWSKHLTLNGTISADFN